MFSLPFRYNHVNSFNSEDDTTFTCSCYNNYRARVIVVLKIEVTESGSGLFVIGEMVSVPVISEIHW